MIEGKKVGKGLRTHIQIYIYTYICLKLTEFKLRSAPEIKLNPNFLFVPLIS